MKRLYLSIALLSLLMVLSLATSAVGAAVPVEEEIAPPLPAAISTGVDPMVSGKMQTGIQSLSGSNVIFYPTGGGQTCYTPGISQTLCFQSETFTSDWEYVYNNWLKFPSSWVVSNVYTVGTPTCTTGNFGPFSWSFQTSPYEVNINQTRNQASSDYCVATYCVDVTPSGVMDHAGVSWYFDGDGYGSTPHNPCSNDGYTPAGQNTCDEAISPPASVPICSLPPGIYLEPELIQTEGCKGSPQTHTFTLFNATGTDANIELDYVMPDFPGEFTGPSIISVADGASEQFDVTLKPSGCLLEGDILHAQLDAEDLTGGYTDSSTIEKTVIDRVEKWTQIPDEPDSGRMDNVIAGYDGLVWSITGYGSNANVRTYDPGTLTWTTVPDSAAPFGVNYARSGCQVDNMVYIYGDATDNLAFTDLWSYDMETNTWAQEAPTGTPPSYDGIWAPAWAADEANGICYLTGGATTPGGGDLSSVYVYDSIANAWLDPLPDFTTARDFHAAFLTKQSATGVPLLCVAGGNNNDYGLTSTQCYDFYTEAWRAENDTIAPLPVDLWGMGYVNQSEDILWVIGGIIGGNLSNQAYLYYEPAEEWFDYGHLESGAVFRTSAVLVDDTVYHIGGSMGGFNYVGLSDRFDSYDCPDCEGPVFTKEAPSEAVFGDEITYAITVAPFNRLPVSVEDYLPDGVKFVPGSLMVDPDVGDYGYDAGNNRVWWEFTPGLMGIQGWKPALVSGTTTGGVALSLSGGKTGIASAPQTGSLKNVLWDQPLSTVNQNAYVSQEFSDYPDYSSFLADDFIAGTDWLIESVFVPGNGWNGFSSLENATGLTWMIYADDTGEPAGDPSGGGDPPLWALTLPINDPQVSITTGSGEMPSDTTLVLSEPVEIPAGHYWLIFYPTLEFGSFGQFGRQPADTANGYIGQFINPGGAFGYGSAWQNWTVLSPTQQDIAFRLEGIAGPEDPVTISFEVTVTMEDTTITNWAEMDYNGYYFETSASTLIAPYNRLFLPVILR